MQQAGALEALALVAPAKVPGPVARPVQRALTSLAAVNTFIAKAGAESNLLEVKEGKDARTAAFPLEAIIRNAVVRFKGPFKKHLRRVKALEDALGHHIDAIERLAEMKTFGIQKIINYWAGRQTEQRKELTKVLKQRWLPHTAGEKAEVPRLAKDLRTAKWGDLASDRDANCATLARDALRVVHKKLDMGNMEEVHALRRACRWYALSARAMSGHIVLVDGGAPEQFNHYLTDPAAKLEFAALPPAKAEPNPIKLPKALWIGGSYVIEELGKLKAKGETMLAIMEYYVAKEGMKPAKAERQALQIMGITQKERDAWTAAAEVLHVEAREIFAAIAEQMSGQIRQGAKR
jgi:hypothetical protein